MNVAEQKTVKSIVTNIIGIGIGNTFCQSIFIGIDSSVHMYCQHP